MSEAYAWFGAAYFFYDMWSMYRVHAALTAQNVSDKIKQVTMSSSTTNQSKLNNGNGQMYDKQQENGNSLPSSENSDDQEKQVFIYDGKAKTSGTGFAKYILSNPIMTIHHIFIGSFGLAVIAVSAINVLDMYFISSLIKI